MVSARMPAEERNVCVGGGAGGGERRAWSGHPRGSSPKAKVPCPPKQGPPALQNKGPLPSPRSLVWASPVLSPELTSFQKHVLNWLLMWPDAIKR